MSVESTIHNRYSVRKYKDTKVEAEKLDKLLEAVREAPTACNRQPNIVYVAQNEEALGRIGKAANIYGAPLALVFCTDTASVWTRKDGFTTTDVDASILTDEVMLLATELGLGSVWICAFDEKVLCSELSLPETLKPINILALGYADEEPKPDRLEKRKSIGELVRFVG